MTLRTLFISLITLLTAVAANADNQSVTFDNIDINTGSTFNGKPAIKVTLATTLNGYRNKDIDCRLFIYDSAKDFLKTRNFNYRYGTDTYFRKVAIKPTYDNTKYNEIFYYINPDDLVLTTGEYQIAIFLTDPTTGETLPGGLGLKMFSYQSNTVESQSIRQTSDKPNSDNTSTSVKSSNSGTYYYFESSNTGNVDLAFIDNVDERYGGGQTLNGFGSVYTYVGMVNGRQKWSSFTIQIIYEEKYVPGFAKPIKISTGKSKRIPDYKSVIFTDPDMSAAYTISDTYDKRISRDRWLARHNDTSSPSATSPESNNNPNSGNTSSGQYHEINRSQYAQCRHCHGSGRCSTCNGTGDRGDSHNRNPNEIVWKCTTCSGSGKCMFCNGLGRIRI